MPLPRAAASRGASGHAWRRPEAFFLASYLGMQSTLHNGTTLHAAIIMDGNGRWAERRGLPRFAGHRAGVRATRAVVEAAPELGISILTLFAFSSDNWKRPASEVNHLIWLLEGYLRADARRFIASGARLQVIGRRDRLPSRLRREIGRIERATEGGAKLLLRIAIDYSSRETIFRAALEAGAASPPGRARFVGLISWSQDCRASDDPPRASEVDLLVRTGGERRLSDFMLWESAYAELIFTDRLWPDFGAGDLRMAVAEFHRRDRRFGAISSRPPHLIQEGRTI
jgi:undecaprenyl diphosphate synthase